MITISCSSTSLIVFYRICKYPNICVVMLCDHTIHESLLLYTVTGFLKYSGTSSSLFRRLRRKMMYLTHSSVTHISASSELRAVIVWHFDIQCNGTLVQMMNTDIDLGLKSSNLEVPGCGFDWSCGPQLASVNGMAESGFNGNLINDWRFKFGALWKVIPNFLFLLNFEGIIWIHQRFLCLLCACTVRECLWFL